MGSLAEAQLKVAEARERLADTLDRTQEKLTIAGVVEAFVGVSDPSATSSGSPADLSSFLRRHPLPVMVVAAGLGFLIYQMSRSSEPAEPLAQIPFDE